MYASQKCILYPVLFSRYLMNYYFFSFQIMYKEITHLLIHLSKCLSQVLSIPKNIHILIIHAISSDALTRLWLKLFSFWKPLIGFFFISSGCIRETKMMRDTLVPGNKHKNRLTRVQFSECYTSCKILCATTPQLLWVILHSQSINVFF